MAGDDQFDDLPVINHVVSSGAPASLSTVNVKVVDGNRAPYFVDGTSTTRAVNEDAGQGAEVGYPVTALDLNIGDTLTYNLEGAGGKFNVSSTGQITVAADDSLDYETAPVHEFKVAVIDTGGLIDKIDVTVHVRDVDEPPVLTGPENVDNFSENSAVSRQVGRYTATDPEIATVSLSLSGTDNDDFTLASNGVLAFKASPDFEEQSSYSVTARAEAGSYTVNLPVAVDLLNIEEPGSITLSSVQPQTDTLLTATLEDGDGPTSTTWQWYRTSSRSSVGGGGSAGTGVGGTPTATGCTPAALTLPASGISGTWAGDCQSEVSSRGYARYYTFNLSAETEVTINLTSSVDTYLYLRSGSATSGIALHQNDDIESGNTNSRIVATLSAGTWTIEATTYSEDTTGDFTLTINTT